MLYWGSISDVYCSETDRSRFRVDSLSWRESLSIKKWKTIEPDCQSRRDAKVDEEIFTEYMRREYRWEKCYFGLVSY